MTGTRVRPPAPPAAAPPEEPPFPGPRPFGRQEAAGFFGRSDEVAELASLVRCHAVVLLYAESGVGKSSLVDAGLRPRLESRAGAVTMTGRVKGEAGSAPPADGNPFVANLVRSLPLAPAPPGTPVPTLAAALAAAEPWGQAPLRLVVVDQLEEVFTLFPERWQDRRAFFEQIQEALDADPRLRFLLAVRADYLSRLYPYTSAFHDDLRTRYGLERLRPRDAVEAILEPTARSSRTFTPDAAALLVEQLRAVPGAEPEAPAVPAEFVDPGELQIVCRDLWLRVPAGDISPEDVRRLAKLGEVHGRFYDRVVARTVRDTRVGEGRLRRWFATALITPGGTRGFLFRDRTSTAGLPNHVVDALEAQQIVRAEQRGSSRFYELTHDRLIPAVLDSNRRWSAQRARRRRRRLATVAAALALPGLVVAGATLLYEPGPPALADLDAVGDLGRGRAGVSFTAGAGPALLSVELYSSGGDPDPEVRVLDPAGREVEAEQYHGDGSVEVVADLPAPGTYHLEVACDACRSYLVRGTPARRQRMEGRTFSARVGPGGRPDLLSLDAGGSDLVVVTVESAAGRDVTVLRAPDEVFGPDYESDRLSRVVLASPETYRLKVALDRAAAYSVRVEEPEVAPLAPGRPIEAGFGPEGGFRVYGFQPPAGQVVLFRVSSERAVDLTVLKRDGGVVQTVDLLGREDLAAPPFGFEVRAGGEYFVVVSASPEPVQGGQAGPGAGGGAGGGAAQDSRYRLSYNTSDVPE